MDSPLQIDATTLLMPGDPAPGFIQRRSRTRATSATARRGGTCCCASMAAPAIPTRRRRSRPPTSGRTSSTTPGACFFGVSLDPEDEAAGRVADRIPGYRRFRDFDLTASRRYGVADKEATSGARRAAPPRR